MAIGNAGVEVPDSPATTAHRMGSVGFSFSLGEIGVNEAAMSTEPRSEGTCSFA